MADGEAVFGSKPLPSFTVTSWGESDSVLYKRVLCLAIFFLSGCVSGPEDCGTNVEEVIEIDFVGPNVLPVVSDQVIPTGYTVTMSVEKSTQDEVATACFVVRDEDPWYKFFWAVDDVLAANGVVFPVGVNSRTLDGHFSLFKPLNDNDICGAGLIVEQDGCASESEAEIYLQTVDSSGPTSPKSGIQMVRLE